MNKENDPFTWRSGGGKFDIGDDENDSTSALIEVDGQLFCVTKKNIRSIIMADTIDPERTNPGVRHSQQQILPYGSENHFVGRILQQASILFEEHALLPNINCKQGVAIAFSFLKELISLDKIKNEYIEEESKINSGFNGQPHSDGSFYLPSIQNLEQKVKTFITNIDHTERLLIETAQLFYPDIKNKNWEEQLYEKIKKQLGEDHECAIFIKSFKKFTGLIRKIRNSIEHPDKDNIFVINNYKLTPQNILSRPSLLFTGKDYSLPETNISEFMTISVENTLLIFESLIAHLCNMHAEPFAGDKRIVVEISPEKRSEQEKHVKFRYQILWTK